MHGQQSLKMLMAWRNLQQKSYVSITQKILESNARLVGSIIYMVLLEHGKVVGKRHLLHFVGKLLLLPTNLRCGEMDFRHDLSPSSMSVSKVCFGASEHWKG
ncbi:hypothetical protein NMG60_11023599 [Bertholletia excelsa]